ncbi:SpaA isopeptide-forming pilin-related protein [uncultured Ruminococcus sp.]|uniref:SpaA isopeptide-forming pilin-related protein n=1 Tax=uncultured Ruminococcus sp. TaxID=165186 RepID=UPI0026764568|nr:SpaA isopeptide-forming pilin-related protein [uncultured Ruminococcus sp.]
MFKTKSKILRKLGAGFMAGLCAFSMLGSSVSGVITANAAGNSTQNSAFPSADMVIAKAATLLGSPYTFGNKGYWYAYNQGQYTPLSVQTINNLGIDCSGLVYYTLTQLGYKTSGFSWNNPVPVDTDHWLSVNDNCTITYDGVTSKVDVEKQNIKTTDRPYWECSDGSTITPGSVVVAQNPYGEDHAWIYMGEFDSKNDVVSYLKSIGVSESLINSKTVGDGKGAGGRHWRIESNGSEGVVINNKTDGKTATAMNMSAFRITSKDVKFTITKVYKADNTVKINGISPIDGSQAIYGVYTDKACKNKAGEIKIDKNGSGSIELPNKQYYVKEIKAPTGYSLSTEVFALNANENVNVTEDYLKGNIIINKTAEDGIIGQREFRVTWTQNGKSHSKTAKTNSSGIAEFKGLNVYDLTSKKAISYTISEINVDTRYETPKAQNVTLTSGDVDLTVNVRFNNELKTGSIKINKQSEDNQNGGREFTVTGNGKTYSIKTGSDGVAILSDIPVYDSNNQKIVYTISEKNVPIKYVVPASQTVTLTADETTSVTFENVLKKFTLEVTKKDSEKAEKQGDASLAGAVYGVFKDSVLIDEYTTDENGYFKTKEYVCGNYTVQEISPSEGYLLDKTVYSVGAEAENYSIEHNPISMTVTEDVIKGNIAIIKHSDDGSTQIETPEVGAEFEVYLKSSGSYEAAKDSEKDYLVCDENGYAATKKLPYGIYVVHQTKGWESTEYMEDFEVVISENEKEYFYLLNDAVKKSFVKIVKKDAETGNVIPVSGIGFKVWDCANSEYISQKIYYPSEMILDTFYTDESGSLMLPQELAYGDYELHEVQSAEGYVLDKNPVPFTIDGSVETVVVEKTNTAQKGRISVQKTGDIFTTVATASSAYTDENCETIVNPTTYTPVFASGNLSGAVFQIIAVEDIVTLDGTIRANAGDVVAEITTDENGYAETDLLYLGKYKVREITAPDGYALNAESQFVELTYAGQEIAVRDTVNTSFVNDYQGVEISLSKVMEKDELFNIGNSDEYTRVRFGLFAAENITAADGSVIPADGLISEISLAENMSAKFDTALPFGKYYVQEIATDEHYVLNGKKYLVNFEYMGQEVTTVTVDCGEFKNALKRGKISGKKVDENEKSLENALFGLFAVDTDEFTADNAYMTAVSNENGHFEFDKIPYGEYIVREIEAPTGYILSDESYPVTISEYGEIIEITAVNKPITVEISKQDVYGNELAGAEMQLENSDGEVVDKWTSDGTNHVVTELPAGDYTLKEIAAPDGYVIATDIKFTVDVYGNVTVENVDSTAVSENGNPLIVMVDDTTKVKISKRDITTDKELAGATLQIIDKDGNVVDEWVSTTEPHFIEAELTAGEKYTLHEAAAPDGYVIANDVEFTVNSDGTVTKVVMYDEHTPDLEIPPTVTIDTPNTGVSADNSAELYLVAAAVIMAFGMVICKRNDKEQRKDDVK